MGLYVLSGDRTWHKIDPSRSATFVKRDAYATDCDAAILKNYKAVDLAEPPQGLCPLCVIKKKRPASEHVSFKSQVT